ncbi:hypothetical protein [Demequina sp.]|uniref:hypothetical protein n=1 Tax=Demequina sp. TaxID=2050685 RepID=UPI003D09819E
MATKAAAKALALLVLGAALAGCGGGSDREAITETGTVSSVQDPGDPMIFVFSGLPQSTLNNAIISVAARNLDGAEPADVERGDEVKVTVTTCTTSLPAQCTATHVEVTK